MAPAMSHARSDRVRIGAFAPTWRRRIWILVSALLCLVLSPSAFAQSTPPTTRDHEVSGWFGLMTDWQLSGPWSIWYDTHLNTNAFFVSRVGLSYRFRSGPIVTGGYAYTLTDPGNGTLERQEHRPWAQLFLPFRFSDQWSVSQRLRFDLRVRERVEDGEVAAGWLVVPRWRSQTAITFWLPPAASGKWFVQGALEILVNGGDNAGPNFLDQNRLSLMLGWQYGPWTLRSGYMDRFVPGASGAAPVHEHDIVFWVNYVFERREKESQPDIPAPERGNP
jgi:hypothetical protein